MSDWGKRAEHFVLYWKDTYPDMTYAFISDLLYREFNMNISEKAVAGKYGNMKKNGVILQEKWIQEYLPSASDSEGGHKPANDSQSVPGLGLGSSTRSSA